MFTAAELTADLPGAWSTPTDIRQPFGGSGYRNRRKLRAKGKAQKLARRKNRN